MVLKLLLIAVFILIFLQDNKDRLVYWFLYLATGILCFAVQLSVNLIVVSLVNTAVNLIIIIVLLLSGMIYSKYIMRKSFIGESIGMGDILFFIAICLAFSTVVFIILLTFALIFALVLHLYRKNESVHTCVPLAGYMALFFSGVYLASFFVEPKYLFA